MEAAPLVASNSAASWRTLGLERRVAFHLLLLTLLSLPVYLFLPLGHGITNTQEALRAVTSHEMSVKGEWIVPTIHDQPYLNKPPLIYWTTLAISALRDGPAGVLDLRLGVAIAGWLGVLATYACGRELLRERGRAYAEDGAFWGAAFLATAILHVRAARTGELDVLLVPLTAVGVLAAHRAWTHRLRTGRTAVGWIALSAIAAGGLALGKGPPALLPMLAAAYGGIALHAAFQPARRPAWLGGPAPVVLSLAAIVAVLALRTTAVGRPREVTGLAMFVLMAPAAVAICLRLAAPARLATLWRGLHATHVFAVLAVAALAFGGWGLLVIQEIGREAVMATAEGQTRANLNILDPDAPPRFVEAVAYGAGLGSFAAIAAVVWLLRDRPAIHRGGWMILGWTALGIALQASLGNGSTRYLTAYWPGVCLLGGWWFASLREDYPREAGRMGAAAAILAIGFAVVQAWWYGHGREYFNSDRSPREMVRELRRVEGGPVGVATLDFWSGAIDIYAGRRTLPINAEGGVIDYPHPSGELARLRRRLERGEEWIVFARAEPAPERDLSPGRQVLAEAGWTVERIPLSAPYRIDENRTPVEALRVRPPVGDGR